MSHFKTYFKYNLVGLEMRTVKIVVKSESVKDLFINIKPIV